jgi:hypothetical protein
MSRLKPVIGQWYQQQDSGQLFEVVAIDDQLASVAGQFIDGEITEYDFEQWQQLPLELASSPKDWSAVYELDLAEQQEEQTEATVETEDTYQQWPG